MAFPRTLLLCLIFLIIIGFCFADTPREEVARILQGKKLRIVTIELEPYATLSKEDDKYVGFLPDVIDVLSEKLGFQYDFYASPDGKWGSLNNASGQWTGMIGELKKWEKTFGSDGADIAAAPLTMSYIREAHVDFLKPFQGVGLTLLAKRPEPGHYYMREFSVTSPLTPAVWGTLAVAAIVVGLALWGNYKISGIGGVIEDQQKFGLAGSWWFIFTTLQWQGFDRTPRPVGARILTCTWFAFVTITIIMYIGGMVYHFDWATRGYFMTLSPLGVKRLADVVQDNRWSYGAIKGGSTQRFIRTADMEVYKDMAKYWDTPEGAKQLVATPAEGIQKIRENPRFAMVISTMTAKHYVNNYCDLITLGEEFAMMSDAMAIPEDHPLEEQLNNAILEMMETGELDELEEKWWTGRGKCWREKTGSIFTGVVPSKKANLKMMLVPLGLIAGGIVFSLLLTGLDVLLLKKRGMGLSGDSFKMKSPGLTDQEGM